MVYSNMSKISLSGMLSAQIKILIPIYPYKIRIFLTE